MQRLNENQILFGSQNQMNSPQKNKNGIKIKHKCLGGNQMFQFCFNKTCQSKNNFLCHDDECQCYQNHQYCSKFGIKTALKKINQKFNLNQTGINQLKTQISDIFTNMINKISEDQELLFNNIKNTLKITQLADLQKNFYQFFNQQKVQNFDLFNGQKLAILCEINSNDKKKKTQTVNQEFIQINDGNMKNYEKMCIQTIQNIKKYFSKIMKSIKKKIQLKNIDQNKQKQNQFKFQDQQTIELKIKINKLSQQKQKQIKRLQLQNQKFIRQIQSLNALLVAQRAKPSQFQSKINELRTKNTELNQKINQLNLKINSMNSIMMPSSSIIKNLQQLIQLTNFFNYKKPIRFKCIFKASENDFDMKKYYQQCGHLSDTIILCQTEHNKILGGYTPLTFNPVKHGQVADNSGNSFLFSLTNNHKFQLKQESNAIYHDTTKSYIAFGSGTIFIIRNNSHDNSFNLAHKYYANENYSDNTQSHQKLTGSSTSKFKMKEWQVLQVIFQ